MQIQPVLGVKFDLPQGFTVSGTYSQRFRDGKADLPGVKKEDINIRIDGNVVQIDAEMKRLCLAQQETIQSAHQRRRQQRALGRIALEPLGNGAFKRGPVKFRPVDRQEDEFGISSLPEQKIRLSDRSVPRRLWFLCRPLPAGRAFLFA